LQNQAAREIDAGLDTAFFVIQYQAYLSQARSTELAAKGEYFKALAGLQRRLEPA
jgi:hypothetical protein